MLRLSQLEAWFDGRWIRYAEVAVPLADAGFVLGVTVSEQMRTFDGKLFRLEMHLDRLFRSLEIVQVQCGLSREELSSIARQVAERNYLLLDEADDLGVGILVTPGDYSSLTLSDPHGPRVCIYAYPLNFRMWADKFDVGQSVVVSSVRQVPTTCWPAELKCRSRMHYYLADREASQRVPGARAILLDNDGYVSEASTANFAIYREGEGLIAPPTENVLPGISLAVLMEIAAREGIPTLSRPIRPDEVFAADEVMLTSTSICVLPVTQCDEKSIGSGKPGDIYHRLLAAWSEEVGVDIPGQARRFAGRAIGE